MCKRLLCLADDGGATFDRRDCMIFEASEGAACTERCALHDMPGAVTEAQADRETEIREEADKFSDRLMEESAKHAAQLTAQRDSLRAALTKYGDHLTSCMIDTPSTDGIATCTCGWDEFEQDPR